MVRAYFGAKEREVFRPYTHRGILLQRGCGGPSFWSTKFKVQSMIELFGLVAVPVFVPYRLI